MNKSWKPILLLIGIFLAGLVSGGLLTAHFGREWLSGRASPEQWATIHLKKLAERLELKPEQVEQIRPIVKRDMDELRRIRNQSMTESRSIFDRMQRDIAEKLTPEQKKEFEVYNRERREHLQKFMQKRPDATRKPGSGPGGERPLPPPTEQP
jgi:Spy/CpxP family protein refolding chaperone